MSRRDTIIIAVLINAGLLAILFMMAVNTDDEKVAEHPTIEQALVNMEPPQQSVETIIPSSTALETPAADEFDHVLNNLAMGETSQPILIEESPPQGSTVLAKKESKETIAPPPQKAEEVTRVDITVKKGDTLEKIAKANDTTISAIMKANNLKSEKLKIGQVLHVPIAQKKETEKSKTTLPATPKATDSKDPEYYVIKSGDNPWKVAKQFRVKFDDLLKLNDLDEDKARNLKVGDKIRIR